MRLIGVQTGRARPLAVGGRTLLSAIGKTAVSGPVAVGPLGLAGDEQADLSVHGGLGKAVYAYPSEHLPWWREQRRRHGSSLFDEPLASGFMGENLSLEGLLEHQVWIGDRLRFPGCVLRVTAPREPCAKWAAVIGLPRAGRLMMDALCSGFYLAVEQPGSIEVGQTFRLEAGPRGLSVAQAFAAKRARHRD